MNAEDLNQSLDMRAFRPFMLNLSNGESYRIMHPDQVIVERTGATVGLGRVDGSRRFEKVVTCALMHVVSLIPLEEVEVT